MKLSDFDFHLPEELIACYPAETRDGARMLVVNGDQDYSDQHFKDFPDLLNAGDVLVLNNTRVIPARIWGKRGEANIETTLHKELGESKWLAFIRGSKRLKIDDVIQFSDLLSATVVSKSDEGVELNFNLSRADLLLELELIGKLPLPPYMKREEEALDRDRYQTVFGYCKGSVAAPTASLHFTDEILEQIKAKGVHIEYVTLHVGAGTFLPVKTEDLSEHKMHAEYGVIDAEVAERINMAKLKGGRVIPVGTTAVRVLESAARSDGLVQPFAAETDIFITPGYQFKIVDGMLTNFHLPKSTLMMLISSLAGYDTVMHAYEHAIEQKYRFYSYGDCCFFTRQS